MSSRKWLGAGIALGTFAVGGIAGAGVGVKFTGGGGGKTAKLECPGGMTRLGHVWGDNNSVFPGDPATSVIDATTIEADGFLVELITTGSHNGTHLDAPGHFYADGRTIDQLRADEFVWPAYVIDVRDRIADPEEADDFQLTIADVKAVERKQGKIPKGAMVIIETGFGELFGQPEYLEVATPGFAGETVQWMVDEREIDGIGSDTLGPDASPFDEAFSATDTILANDRVAMPDIANVDSLNPNGDLIIASAVALENGSAFMVDPLGCHAK